MTKSVLLLRAVNVGGRNTVPMARLRDVLRPILGEVSTYIASGNVVCEHPADPAGACSEVRAAIAAEFAVDTPVILRPHESLVRTLSAPPFAETDEKLSHVMFLEGAPVPGAAESLRGRLLPGEEVALVGEELWINFGEQGVHASKLTKAVLDRALGVAGTARNLRTTRRLVELTA